MPSRRVAQELNAGTYYLTLTVQRWYYLFDPSGTGYVPRPERLKRGRRMRHLFFVAVAPVKRCGRGRGRRRR
jgi:hypothetical protein